MSSPPEDRATPRLRRRGVAGRTLLGALALGALGLSAGACDENRKRPGGYVDSETHWLEPCDSDATCGDLQCLCGFCALPCAEVSACTGLPEAVCATSACGAQGLCTRACERTADCLASGLTCSAEGACVPVAAVIDGMVSRDQGVPDFAVPDEGLRVDAALPDQGPLPDEGPLPDLGPPDLGPPPVGCAVAGSTCQTDAQCGADQACAPASIGEPCACLDRPARQRSECPADVCCADAECPAEPGRGAVCTLERTDRQQVGCGGAAPGPANQCLSDACVEDADCGGGQACVRAGQYGFVVSTCVPSHCRSDADCTDHPGGECTPFFVACRNAGFWCTYTEDPCRTDADCRDGGEPRFCQPVAGEPTRCVVEGPPPP